MPLSCFLCGQWLRAGTRKFTLIATRLAPRPRTATRRVTRHRNVNVCCDCFAEIEPATSAEHDAG